MEAEEPGRRLREGDRSAAPAALNLIEDRSPGARERTARLLAELSPAALGGEAPAHLIGITGPPGAGKSSLLSALVAHWRAQGRTVAVLAVDPSSKRSGGSLLGDRARIDHDPRDDAVALVVQPGSGDTLQFLKAGFMEVPHVLVVTKADLGEVALTARRDLSQALVSLGARGTPVVAVSSLPPPEGIDKLAAALDEHRAGLDVAASRLRARRQAAIRELVVEHGEAALRSIGGRREAEDLLAQEDRSASVA